MASTRFRILIPVTAVLAAMAPPAGAAPIVSSVNAATAHYASNPLAYPPGGEFLHIRAVIFTPDPPSVNVVATQGSLTVPLSYRPQFDPLLGGDHIYEELIPFVGAPTGSWTITATDSTGTSSPVLTVPIFEPELLPFVTGITVSDASITPTVSWTLPDLTGFDVDGTTVRIIDATTEARLLQQDLPTTTSSVVPGGILVFGRSYLYQIALVDGHAPPFNGFENASQAFSGVTQVPEPGILTLLLAALASIGGARLHPYRSKH